MIDEDVPSLTAGDVARLTGGAIIGDAEKRLVGVAPLEGAGSGDLSFLVSRRFLDAFHKSRADAILVAPALQEFDNGRSTRIVVEDPYRALDAILRRLAPRGNLYWGIDASAVIGTGVTWDARIRISGGVNIGSGTQFGCDCIIGACTSIGKGVVVGNRVHIGPHVTIADDVVLGDDVTVKTGARLGSEGFGYRLGKAGHERVRHVGGCIVHDGVDIGANSTVDRGSVGDTVIGEHTKIDNLVHVGHNCHIGKRCLIMAQVGMAGSTVIEDDAILAGQAGLAGHLTVGSGARVAAQAGVIGDVPRKATVSGYPARDHRAVLRHAAAVARLARHVKTLERLATEAEQP